MNGDLGMVEYIFSDKTGTLTENCMVFKQCSVGGAMYGVSADNEADVLPLTELQRCARSNEAHANEFLLVLSAAHTIVIDEATNELQAESPDELALLEGAALMGYKYIGRDGSLSVRLGLGLGCVR